MDKKTWRVMTLIQLTLVLVSLSVFSMGLNSLQVAARAQAVENTASIPVESTKPQEVDYKKIETMIQERVDELPKPRDGQDSVSKETTHTVVEKVPLQPELPQEVELRTNPQNGNLEWRLGEQTWRLLKQACELTNTCSEVANVNQ